MGVDANAFLSLMLCPPPPIVRLKKSGWGRIFLKEMGLGRRLGGILFGELGVGELVCGISTSKNGIMQEAYLPELFLIASL